jgi:hypothetical protein
MPFIGWIVRIVSFPMRHGKATHSCSLAARHDKVGLEQSDCFCTSPNASDSHKRLLGLVWSIEMIYENVPLRCFKPNNLLSQHIFHTT